MCIPIHVHKIPQEGNSLYVQYFSQSLVNKRSALYCFTVHTYNMFFGEYFVLDLFLTKHKLISSFGCTLETNILSY